MPRYAGTPLSSDWDRLQRRRKLEESLLENALSPYQGTQHTGSGPYRFAVDDRLGTGISKIGQALISAWSKKKTDEQEKELSEKFDVEQGKATKAVIDAMTGVPEKPYELSPSEQFANEQIPGLRTAAVEADPMKAAMMASTDPYLKDNKGLQAVTGAMISQKAPKASYKVVPEMQPSGKWRNREVVSGVKGGLVGGGYAKGPSASSTNVTTTLDNKGATKFVESLGKEEAKQFLDGKALAEDSVELLQSNIEALKLMDEGMIAGAFANLEVGIGTVLHKMGINYKKDAIENAQAYSAAASKRVASIIKAFGSGTGLSDADRDYASKAAAGDITMNAGTLRKVIDINKRAAEYSIKRHNKKAKSVQDTYKDLVPYSLQVDMPGASQEAPPPGGGKEEVRVVDW